MCHECCHNHEHQCPFSCLRSGIKNEGGSSYLRISLKLRKACSVILIKREALCFTVEVRDILVQNSAEVKVQSSAHLKTKFSSKCENVC